MPRSGIMEKFIAIGKLSEGNDGEIIEVWRENERCVLKKFKVYDSYINERSAINALSLEHRESIVIPYEFIDAEDGTFCGYELMEKYDCDLLTYILDHPLFDIDEVKRLFKSIVVAIDNCHKSGIAHMDIKPDNVMVKNGPDGPSLFVSDFSLSTNRTEMHCFCGSESLAAPEAISCEINPRAYNCKQTDIWSLGILLYAMLTKDYPWLNASPEDPAFYKFMQMKSAGFEICEDDDELLSLFNSMLDMDPKKRASTTDILSHKWLAL